MIGAKSKFTKQYALYFSILFSVVSTFLEAQTTGQTYAFAISQSKMGNYDIAIKSLKRLQFFDESNNFPSVFQVLADCYYWKTDYENAYYYYDLAGVQIANDSLLTEIVASKVTCKLYSHQYQQALIDLLSFDKQMNTFHQWQFNMLFGITYFYLGEIDQSEAYFMKTLDSASPQLSKKLELGFNQVRQVEKRYNPNTARMLSFIIPGSGQIWAGDYRNGANSFLLIAGLVSASVAISESISLLDSIIIIAPWFQRYYMGGYQKAHEISLEKQLKEKNKILAQIVHMLDQNVVR